MSRPAKKSGKRRARCSARTTVTKPPAAGVTRPSRPAKAAAAKPPSRPAAKPGWRRLFRVVAVLFPLLLLAGLEIGLRVAGYGYPTTFLIPREIGGTNLLVENERFGWRFFPREIARSPAPLAIQRAKSEGTFRILIFGESAALGDPRPAYGVGPHLEALLRERFPAGRFEVIPLAMTAINSHALRLMAREAAGLEADLWIVYAGNNELMGPFGASGVLGSTAPPLWLVRAGLTFKATRIGQWLEDLARRFKSPAPRGWGGLKMFQDHLVAPDAPARAQVYASFRANLTDLVRAGRGVGAEVLLCTVASNLRDSGPFASIEPADAGRSTPPRWRALADEASRHAATNDWPAAERLFGEAASLATNHAQLRFSLAQCRLARTNRPAALKVFLTARDLDALPFRADGRINGAIRAVAKAEAGRGVRFLDLAAALNEAAREGIAGDDLFFEHVHFNLNGNYQFARRLAEEVLPLLPAAFREGARSDWADPERCAHRLGLTDWNRAALLDTALARMSDAPFTNRISHARNVAALAERRREVRARLEPSRYFDARGIYEEALRYAPDNPRLHENFAEFLEANGEYDEALGHWQAMERLWPQQFMPHYYAGRALARLKRFADAREELRTVLAMRPDFFQARLELAAVLRGEGHEDQALVEYDRLLNEAPHRGTILIERADLLAAMDRRDEAVESLQAAIAAEPGLWKAHYLLGVELAMREDLPAAAREFATTVRLRPDFPLAHFNLGIALVRLGRVEEARREFQNTLRLDPEHAQARASLQQLDELLEKLRTQPDATGASEAPTPLVPEGE